MHWGKFTFCCAFHKNYYNHFTSLDFQYSGDYNGVTNTDHGGAFMFKVSELAMPKTRRVTTVCNGRKEAWEDREEALIS